MTFKVFGKTLGAFAFAVLVVFSLGSCEDTNQSRIEISISPEVPVVGDFEFETDEETISPNWFAYQMSFSNPTSQRLIIRTVKASYAIGTGDFGNETELSAHPSLSANYFLDVDSGDSGLEFVHLPNVGVPFVRYIFGLVPDPVAPRNHNYKLKFVFEGYFTEDTTSDTPTPTEKFEKTLFFRTKRND